MENIEYLSDMKKIGTQIRFDVDGHQLDANTLINTLVHYKNLVEEVNRIASNGEREVDIRINALEPGSFIIDIMLVTDLIEKLFSGKAIEYAANLSSVLLYIMTIYNKQKGHPVDVSKPEYQQNITINNSTVNIYNIYNNQSVRAPISKIYETAHNDKSVEGLSFSDKKGDLIGVDRDNFEELQYDEFYKEVGEPKENIITKENASLKIVKLSFEKDRRWTFIYEGNKISITVSDPALMDHINNGTSFSKGDSLIVDLEIIQKYDYEYNTFVNKDYKITAFKEHIHAPSQTSLDFPAHE